MDHRPMQRHTRVLAADADGRLVEDLVDDGVQDRLVACAPHGGDVEPATGRQAARLSARRGATCWRCRGTADGGGAFDRWHVPSTAVDPADFPLLSRIADRGFDRAVAFHGHAGDGVLVGGGAPAAEKRRVADAVAAAVGGPAGGPPVRVATEGPYAGTSDRNLVNWLTGDGGGVQVEQAAAVRADSWRAVADAVARVVATGDESWARDAQTWARDG